LVAVIGGGSAAPSVLEQARALGRELARARLSLVTGGLGGVMRAASRGVCEGRAELGGDSLVLGLIPGTEAAQANPFVDVVVPTGLGIGRNLLVVRSGEAVVAVGGGSGTLSELAFAWQLGKPIAALSQSGGVAARLAGTALDERRRDLIEGVSTPAEAVAWVCQRMGYSPLPGE
jgi:uncharacterized protein (TIGR00725 family)